MEQETVLRHRKLPQTNAEGGILAITIAKMRGERVWGSGKRGLRHCSVWQL